MHLKLLIPALALLCTLGYVVQASDSTLETFDVPPQSLSISEEHELARRGGASKIFQIFGGIVGVIGGFLAFQPELVAFGGALAILGGTSGTVGTILSRRDGDINLGKAIVADEPDLYIHSTEVHPSGNSTDFVISGRNSTAGNAVYMEITHHHETNEVEGIIIGSKTGLSRRAVSNSQHIKFSFKIFSRPNGGYDRAQLSRFAHSMANSVATHKRDTSCHGSMINEHVTWNGKITIGTVAQLRARRIVNDCSRDPKAYGQYFSEKLVTISHKGQAAHSFLAAPADTA
ncbi:hypothetical protein HDU97_003376 [Phlyctochytrium planicorne]|nr:hypothetical protein HDU97_003376 [Phlyctochytrium planicorne]